MKNLFLLGALLIPTIVYSANDLERWNSEVGRTIRQSHTEKLAQTTYTEMDSRNVTVSQDMKTVHPQIETRSQVAGSRTRVVAEATLVVDKDKVWRDWNRKLNKWGTRVGYGAAAVQIGGLILDAVDWVMDPENNTITKKPSEVDSNFQNPPFLYYDPLTGVKGFTAYQACTSLGDYHKQNAWKTYTFTFSNDTCHFTYDVKDGRTGFKYSQPLTVSENLTESPKLVNKEVSEEEKERVLKDLLNDPKYANLAADMIRNTYSIGSENPEPDPNIVNDIKDAQKGTLKSDDPKGDGRTRTDPKIDTGTQGQADTTPKPDTGTGTNPDTGTGTTPTPNPSPDNGSTTNFELPAFCNYAAKLCDWLDWSQEDKELEEPEKEEPEELDLGTIDKDRFSANGQCPAPKEIDETVKALGRNVNFDFKIEWTPICSVAEDTSPLVLLISTITGLLILVGGGRSSEP